MKIYRRSLRERAICLFVALAGVTWLAGAAARAHDFWIEPEQFRPRVGHAVPLRLFVGEHFKGEPVLYLPHQFERYLYVGPTGEHPVAGELGDDPAGTLTLKQAGHYVVGYHSKKFEMRFRSIEKFESYLEMEGLERYSALAKKRFRLRGGLLETYSRYAKALLLVGNGNGPADRVLGFPLELIAETDPYSGARKMSVRLLYQGKPLEGALVIALNERRPLERQEVRSDADGRAVFELAESGVWLIKSVHMLPTSILSRADWDSFWASLTFERP